MIRYFLAFFFFYRPFSFYFLTLFLSLVSGLTRSRRITFSPFYDVLRNDDTRHDFLLPKILLACIVLKLQIKINFIVKRSNFLFVLGKRRELWLRHWLWWCQWNLLFFSFLRNKHDFHQKYWKHFSGIDWHFSVYLFFFDHQERNVFFFSKL